MMGHWDNPLIAAAIPVLLQVERVRDQKQLNPAAVRAQIVREIQQFQQTLLADHVAPGDVDKLAYLLCSYVDECCMSTLESGELNLSLLVEFYRDAGVGKNASSTCKSIWPPRRATRRSGVLRSDPVAGV